MMARFFAVGPAWLAAAPTLWLGWVPWWYVAVYAGGFAGTGVAAQMVGEQGR